MCYQCVKNIKLYICTLDADEMLKSLEAERNLFEAREIFLSEHSFNEKDAKNIQEHWTEDELDKWRSKKYIITFSHLSYPGFKIKIYCSTS